MRETTLWLSIDSADAGGGGDSSGDSSGGNGASSSIASMFFSSFSCRHRVASGMFSS
jgi:hypothetical protein